ncbi:MAG: NAD(P)H-hydrate dehydratase [Candidatus Omnitrophica bacterium]|nr:NAD(P)H-hydrate dehydratase [Candidatus Omnitrophota bacterium]MCM8830668.1 NAD(P)H-hydrate dehydratase [Candidatus Omnitrophota bacterium]
MKLPTIFYKRKKDTHKGDYGYVFVLGGSVGLTGAVCLCAQAALRIGAGLVRVGVPKSLNHIFEIKLTEVMSLPLEEEKGYLSIKAFNQIKDFLKNVDVIALGCGAGRHTSTKKLFLKLLTEIDKTFVVDADGINALASNLEILKNRKSKNLVLTPHLGEFSRLLKLDIEKIKQERKELVKDFSFRYNLVLVLKGNRSLVSNGKALYENRTGNPGMATAGTGDVLTGIISGLIAQGMNIFEAAKLGVYLHGRAADLATKEKLEACLIASDVIEYLPVAIKSMPR